MLENKKKTYLTAPKKMKILFTIINRKKCDFYVDILEGYEANIQLILYGKGTAPSQIQHILGLIESDKAVIISLVREEFIKDILNAYEDKYFKTKNGQGIAFSISLNSTIGKSTYELISNMEAN